VEPSVLVVPKGLAEDQMHHSSNAPAGRVGLAAPDTRHVLVAALRLDLPVQAADRAEVAVEAVTPPVLLVEVEENQRRESRSARSVKNLKCARLRALAE
jgi:hypothetical protein